MGEIGYRIRQFWQVAFAPPLDQTAVAAIAAILTPAELDLFQRFDNSDRQHSYRVLRLLQTAGHDRPELLAAALLHDVGKTRVRLTVWERSLIVVGQKLWPKQTAVWGQGEAAGWKRPFVVRAQHPAWGAEMAAAAGSQPLTVELIRRHQESLPETAVSATDDLLRLLQWADDQS